VPGEEGEDCHYSRDENVIRLRNDPSFLYVQFHLDVATDLQRRNKTKSKKAER
jgi:hypothetical protein